MTNEEKFWYIFGGMLLTSVTAMFLAFAYRVAIGGLQ